MFAQLSGLRRLDARVAALVEDPRIGALAARLAGVGAIRLWNDQALFQPPFGNPTASYLDAPYWSFEDRRAITIWVALDDATVENGCLWYLPGTHAEARFDAVELGGNLGGLFDHYPEWRSRASVPAVLPAGGAVWHNGHDGRRDSFVRTEAEAAALRPGDPLDDAAINPLVWPPG